MSSPRRKQRNTVVTTGKTQNEAVSCYTSVFLPSSSAAVMFAQLVSLIAQDSDMQSLILHWFNSDIFFQTDKDL